VGHASPALDSTRKLLKEVGIDARMMSSGYAQAVGPVEHPQSGGPPAARPASTPAAQPTPARTMIAPISQFFAQAPHSMHAPDAWLG
jgi:hypothetical protein